MILNRRHPARVVWPDNKRFAFTIVDDTDTMMGDSDEQAIDRLRPVYDFLLECGIKTTKTVWVFASEKPHASGVSLENDRYLKWIFRLRERGVEIASHGAAASSSGRERTIHALEHYRQLMGEHPRIHTNHVGNAENIYWYQHRLVGIPSLAYKAYNAIRRGAGAVSLGHKEGSPYFWGDICRQNISFVRNFVFSDINTLARDPWMPYYSPAHPFVRAWFSASNGGDLRRFNRLLSEENQDRLVEEGGCCIVYTHFAFGFTQNGQVHPRFASLIRRLSKLRGYFVPASEVLGYLQTQRGPEMSISAYNLRRLQSRWLHDAILAGRGRQMNWPGTIHHPAPMES